MSSVVIGLGTGRCGTKSLSVLLRKQRDVRVYHEYKDLILPWDFDKHLIDRNISEILNIKAKVIGDIAFYYINYVYYIMDKIPDVKFIVMERPKEEVVDSFVRKVGNLCHWCECGLGKNQWTVAFPKFSDVSSREEGIGKYWDLYKQKVTELINTVGDRVKLINVYELNTRKVQSELAKFLGISDWEYISVHENKGPK